jgi:alkylation response protein AidB-like acyl-CoA dehydrogenase
MTVREDTLFRDSVRRYVERYSPEARVREVIDASTSATDLDLWRGMARDLGVQGLAVPEERGGAGVHWTELMLVFEELGRSLACVPALATLALAVPALRFSGDDAAVAAHLPGIASGDSVATLAVTEPDGRWAPDAVLCGAAPVAAGGWRLDGVKAFVPHGCAADLLVVAARTASGVSLFTVDGDAGGLTREPMTTLDPTRPLARLSMTGVSATLVGAQGAGWPVVDRVLDVAAVALAAEQVGVAERCLELSVAYAGTRSQFGRLIGSFQAIKHRCADMLVDVEAARSAARHAATCLAAVDPTELTEPAGPNPADPTGGSVAGPAAGSVAGPAERTEWACAAAMARLCCGEAAERVTRETIQVHGGIGFTWEHPAHLYLRRATSSRLLFGDLDFHAERVLGALGVGI